MLGLGFGEIMILLVVLLVVVGPRELPSLMRTAGQWVNKLKRMSTDLRSQSGIDEIIRNEGLQQEIETLRSLSRVNVMDSVVRPMLDATDAKAQQPGAHRPPPAATDAAAPAAADPYAPASSPGAQGSTPSAEQARADAERAKIEAEYPSEGCDSYGALSDDAAIYVPEPEGSEIGEAPGTIDDEAASKLAVASSAEPLN